MPAYVIADIDVHDAEKFEEYKKLSAPSAAPFGAKYLVRRGRSRGAGRCVAAQALRCDRVSLP